MYHKNDNTKDLRWGVKPKYILKENHKYGVSRSSLKKTRTKGETKLNRTNI